MPRMTLRHFAKDLFIVFGLVMVWRGIWYIFDEIDKIFFGGGHFFTAVGGVAVGLAMLYFPDKDLKEIEKL